MPTTALKANWRDIEDSIVGGLTDVSIRNGKPMFDLGDSTDFRAGMEAKRPTDPTFYAEAGWYVVGAMLRVEAALLVAAYCPEA